MSYIIDEQISTFLGVPALNTLSDEAFMEIPKDADTSFNHGGDWFAGYTHTEKSKTQMSKTRTGKIFTDSHTKNISSGVKNYYEKNDMSESALQKMSQAKRTCWWITPWGAFETSRLAMDHKPNHIKTARDTLRKYCNNNMNGFSIRSIK